MPSAKTARRPRKLKAALGPGVFAYESGTPLESLSRSPQRLMKRAQQVYHTNEWVHAAESLISGKFASVKWHLEDSAGETLEERHAPQELLKLLRKPNPDQNRTQLWSLTCRHLGLTGNAFWYLDSLNPLGQAVGINYVNPARMWPALDQRGNLQGWILDADRPNGRDPVPFTLPEIMHFVLDPPDEGYFGVGKVEAAWTKILLAKHSGEHPAKMLAAGGRLAGLMWADAGVQLNDEQFRDWVRQMRAVSEDPDASKRVNMLKFPVKFQETAAKPNEIQVPELSMLARDDLLAMWHVPPSQLGLTQARGLNSGETMKHEEAALWQNAIEPRLTPFIEIVQERIVDPFGELSLILEVPEFDDQLPMFQVAEKARYVPMKVDQRLALVGMDPLDSKVYGDLGQQIYVDKSMQLLASQIPEPIAAPPVLPTGPDDREEMPDPGELAGKAKLHFEAIRARLEREYTPKLREAVAKALDAQKLDLARRVAERHEHLRGRPTDVTAWWDEEREHRRLIEAVSPLLGRLTAEVGSKTSATFFRPAKADRFLDRLLDFVRTRVAVRIREINDSTKAKVRELVERGIGEGLGPAELGTAIRDNTAFDEYRSELIARTETALAYNDAALGTYRSFDVEQVQAIDGDVDAECAARNGNIYSLDEASGITDHPNGTLDWVPIVKARIEPPKPDPILLLAEAIANKPDPFVKAEGLMEQILTKPTPPSAVSVMLPDSFRVEVPPIEMPVVAAPTLDVSGFAAVVERLATVMTPRRKRIERDAQGRIVGLVEE